MASPPYKYEDLGTAQQGFITRASGAKALPPGAILMSDKDIMKYKMDVISKWKPKSEVWPFKYGNGMLAAVAGLGGVYMNNFYRRALKLKSFARMSTYVPSVVLPSLTAALLHHTFVTTDILLERSLCPVCLETRSFFIQLAAGGLYPLLLAPAAAFSFADRYYTYPVPPLSTNFKDVLALWLKLTRPRLIPISVIIASQALLALYITNEEARVSFKLFNSYEVIIDDAKQNK